MVGIFDKATLPIISRPESNFSKNVRAIAREIEKGLPKPKKDDIVKFTKSFVRIVRE